MRPAAHPPLLHGNVPEGANNGMGAGAALRSIISSALKQRRVCLGARVNGRGGPEMTLAMGKLNTWLERNPYPSPATVRAFPLAPELVLVMPGTKQNEPKMAQLRKLLAAT